MKTLLVKNDAATKKERFSTRYLPSIFVGILMITFVISSIYIAVRCYYGGR